MAELSILAAKYTARWTAGDEAAWCCSQYVFGITTQVMGIALADHHSVGLHTLEQ